MRELIEILRRELEEGRDTLMVNVISSSGSVPRGAGAKMLIGREGRIYGSIGGGALEYSAEKKAMELLEKKGFERKDFVLKENQPEDLGMVCGGNVDLCFSYFSVKDQRMKEMLERTQKLYEEDRKIWFIMDLSDSSSFQMNFYSEDSGYIGERLDLDLSVFGNRRAVFLREEKRSFYIEKISEPGYVYIFGGGHVAQALVPVLHPLGFKPFVLENREEFCRAKLFRNLAKTLLIDFEKIDDFMHIGKEDYVCIMSRGHKDDALLQAQVLRSPARYIGVIGSARKKASMMRILREEGFEDQDLLRIHSPIGIEIAAETPEEIAISIAAELIAERAKNR